MTVKQGYDVMHQGLRMEVSPNGIDPRLKAYLQEDRPLPVPATVVFEDYIYREDKHGKFYLAQPCLWDRLFGDGSWVKMYVSGPWYDTWNATSPKNPTPAPLPVRDEEFKRLYKDITEEIKWREDMLEEQQRREALYGGKA